MCFSSGGTSDAAADAEKKRQKAINQGMGAIDSAFSGFNDDFWNQRNQDYLNYYQPQLDQQYGDAKQNLLFGMARNGLSQSSAGAKAYSDLDRDYGTQEQGLVSGANDYVTKAKQSVQDEENALVNQLTASGNATQAANAAQAQAQIAAATPSFSPLADLFTNTATVFGNNLALTGNYGGTGTVASLANPYGVGAASIYNNGWQSNARGAQKLVS